MEELLSNSEIITKEMGPNVYGTTGQMKSSHYSLECDWTAWLWGHGGSIFNKDGKFTGNDEAGLQAMAYWDKLKDHASGVDGWTWDGEGQSVAQASRPRCCPGASSSPISTTRPRPRSRPVRSRGAAQGHLAAHRRADRLRRDPGVGHQGGSSLAVSRYSKNADAAWIFMQWATCADTQVLITTLGGGTGRRARPFMTTRVLANARVEKTGTTRHLPVVRETISKHMGSEPDLPQWAQLSNDTIPVRSAEYFAGGYGSGQRAMDDIAAQIETVMKNR